MPTFLVAELETLARQAHLRSSLPPWNPRALHLASVTARTLGLHSLGSSQEHMFAAMADVAWDEAMMRVGAEACQDTRCPTPLSRPLPATFSPAVIFLPDSSNFYIREQQGQYISLQKAEE